MVAVHQGSLHLDHQCRQKPHRRQRHPLMQLGHVPALQHVLYSGMPSLLCYPQTHTQAQACTKKLSSRHCKQPVDAALCWNTKYVGQEHPVQP